MTRSSEKIWRDQNSYYTPVNLFEYKNSLIIRLKILGYNDISIQEIIDSYIGTAKSIEEFIEHEKYINEF